MGSRPVGSLYFIVLLAQLSTPELTKNSLMAAKGVVLHSSESGKGPRPYRLTGRRGTAAGVGLLGTCRTAAQDEFCADGIFGFGVTVTWTFMMFCFTNESVTSLGPEIHIFFIISQDRAWRLVHSKAQDILFIIEPGRSGVPAVAP